MQSPFSRTYFELLAEQASRTPDATVAIADGKVVSYAELHRMASRVAGALKARGVGRGDAVGILINNRIEWLEVLFGAAALGATVVPLSTWSKGPELDFLLADSGIKCLFLIERLGGQDFAGDIAELRASGRHPALERVVLVDGSPRDGFESYADYRNGDALDALPPGEGVSATDTVVVLYTSGSSSRPKSVPLQHFAAVENGFNIGERQGLVPGDRVLVSIPLFWSYGAVNALPATLSHGATLVLQGRFEPGEALDLIETHGCTALYTLPAMTNALVAHPDFSRKRTRTLRTGVTIGAPQDVLKAAEVLGAAGICNIYGSTEVYGNCCVTSSTWPLEERAHCQGMPLPGVTVRIRDLEAGTLVGIGDVGGVEIKGYLMPGYRGDSARHNADVITDDGWFRTGDIGHLDENGRFHFAGRSSEMIKRSGINVSPAEVEEALQQHPAVGIAGVTGLADAHKGEAIVAYVVPKPGVAIEVSALVAHCKERLSGYKVPDIVRLANELPLTPTGKLMRRELKAMAEKDEA
ncbi:MAG: class I adenylate-forming enzyme family protein [Hyphomicrobiaceae bacterium]